MYPQYVIDDDMYSICKYFFVASHVIHKIRNTKKEYMLKVTIIPNNVICIYDKNMELPFGLKDFNTKIKQFKSQSITSKLNGLSISVVTNLFENGIRNIDDEKCKALNIIVDRRQKHQHKVYFVDNVIRFSDVDKNKCISMSFVIT
eukprot:228863_1